MSRHAPSIKGSGISSLIEDIAKMRDDGRASGQLLEERLSEADRRLLDHPVNLAGWYDIHSYRRLAELLCEIEGRREDLLRERGSAAAERLAAAGLYQQMETVTRLGQDDDLEGDAAFQAYGRLLRMIATLSGSLLNFSRFRVEVDPEHADRYAIHIQDGEHFPEVLAYTTEGFINAMAKMGSGRGRSDSWVLDRSGGELRYRMTRPV